jgi:predicted restriction endonuclease
MKRDYRSPEYMIWRKKIYERDRYKCQWPGCLSSKKINAHHIKTWANFPGLRFDTNNGITLCKNHHELIKGIESYYEAVFLKIVLDNQKKYDK